MPRIRIIFDASPLLVNRTGIAYYIERVVSGLAAHYPDKVELVGFYYNFLGRRSVQHLPKAPNLRFHPVRFTPSKLIYQLRRWGIEFPVEYLGGTRADFVLYFNFFSYPSLRRTPSAPVIHDTAFLDMPETVAAKNRSDLVRFVPTAIKRSSFVIAVSEFTKYRIHEWYGVPTDKVLVTPIPSETPRRLAKSTQQKLLKQAGLNMPYILFVGTIEPRKNIPGLIEAYKLLPEATRQRYGLAIAGRLGWGCEAEEMALTQAREGGYDVKHLGYVDEDTRAALFMNCSLFVTASNYEGFGMPVTEAMAYGAPVAVSDIPVFREVTGNNALYFDQRDPQKIAEALSKVLANHKLHDQLVQTSRRQTAQLSWETITKDLYGTIIKTLNQD